MAHGFSRNLQYYKFCLYGFFKNLRLFDAFLVLFLLENDMSFVKIGILYSIREIALALTEIPSGVIADTLGRKRTLIGSFIFYIISFFIFYLAKDFFWFATAMLVFAIGDAFRTGVHKAMIYQYLNGLGWSDQKVSYYGHTRSWSQFGSAISALLAAGVVFYSGSYRLIFLISVIPYLLDALIIASYPAYLDGTRTAFNYGALKKAFTAVMKAFIQSFRRLYFIRVLTSSSIYTGYYRAIKDYIQPLIKIFALSLPVFAWMEGEQKTAVIVGVIYFLSFMLNAFASRKAGHVASRYTFIATPLNLTLLTGFFLGLITGISFHYGFFIVSILCFMILLALENLRKPMGVSLIADLSKDEAMASVLSASSQAKSILAAMMAPVLGYFADLYGPGTAIALLTLLLLILTPLYWLKRP
jgi:MFS family permease